MNQSQENIIAEDIFLDANILLEIILSRDKEALARRFLERHSEKFNISALTAHLLMHFGINTVSLSILRKFLADYTILPLEDADFEWAFNNIRNQDFEDALQIGIAIRNGCGKFITFDRNLFNAYKDLSSIQVQLLN
jgi:predicted nucleic acid-binding protein